MIKENEDNSRPKLRYNSFIPDTELLQSKYSRSNLVSAVDPFISHNALKTFSALFSEENDKLPKYIVPFKDIVDNIIAIPDEEFDSINKWQIQREKKKRGVEKKLEAVEQKIQSVLDRKVDRVMMAAKFFVKRACPVKIPFKSTLSHEEHEFYLRSFIKFQIRPFQTKREEEEYNQYVSLQNRVYSEQACLMNFSYKVAQIILEQYNGIEPPIENYIKERTLHRCKRVLSYPQYFRSELKIPIKPQDEAALNSHIHIQHLGHLLSLGEVAWMRLPNTNYRNVLTKDESVSRIREPTFGEEPKRHSYMNKCPVSEDPNAEFLAKEHKATIIMSLSAFRAIADNQDDFSKLWNIPVCIKSYDVPGGNGNNEVLRVTYIDKPLTKTSWSPLEMKSTFFKQSILANFIWPNYSSCRMEGTLNLAVENENEAYIDDIFGSLTEDYDDGQSLKEKSPENPSQSTAVHCDSPRADDVKANIADDLFLTDDDEEEEDKTPSSAPRPKTQRDLKLGLEANPQEVPSAAGPSLLDNILDKQESFLKQERVSSYCYAKNVAPPAWMGLSERQQHTKMGTKKPWDETRFTDWSKCKKLKDCCSNGKVNYHYQLFSFERNLNNAKATSEMPFRMIIRHNIHGLAKLYKMQNFTEAKAYVVFPKLENQIYFGCEVNSLSEIIQQWAALILRPHTTLLHVRLCVDSGSVVLVEERSLESILKEGKQPHIKFDPQVPLATMHAVICSMATMPSGQYLLHHDPKTGAFISLMKAFDSKTSYIPGATLDLHDAYSSGSGTFLKSAYKSPPWLAVDTHVLTPFHLIHKKIPATFPMENTTKILPKKERKRRRNKAEKKKTLEEFAVKEAVKKRAVNEEEEATKKERRYF